MGMDKSGFFNSFHRNSHGELKSTFFDPFEVKHRKRTSKTQLKILEKTFESNKKPDSALRNQLSEQLGMTPRSVQVWFQNRRAKQKKAKNKKSERPPRPLDGKVYENKSYDAKEYDIDTFNSNYSTDNRQHIPQFDTTFKADFDPKECDIEPIIFQPIMMENNLMEPTLFCNDRYPNRYPIQQLNEYPLKDHYQNEQEGIQNESFPAVEDLDSSWVELHKQFEQDENLSENSISFDPDNFFC